MKCSQRTNGRENPWAGRQGGLRRQWSILGLIRGRRMGISVPEIARELDIPIRTAYQDLQTMSAVLPIYTERQNGIARGRGYVELWKVLDDE